jgi:hypothetical protein
MEKPLTFDCQNSNFLDAISIHQERQNDPDEFLICLMFLWFGTRLFPVS